MGKLDRFLRLERPRPDREECGSSAVLDRFRDPAKPAAGGDGVPGPECEVERGPRSCARCGANNAAISLRCFDCDADLTIDDMSDHQHVERRGEPRRSDEERRRAEELAQREFERIRQEAGQQAGAGPIPAPGSTHLPPLDLGSASPLVWALRALGAIEDPGYRFGARLALIGALVGLIAYSLSAPGRYPWMIFALILIGGGVLRGRRYARLDRLDRGR